MTKEIPTINRKENLHNRLTVSDFLFISIIGIMFVAIYIQGVVLKVSVVPESYAYLDLIFFFAFLGLIVSFAINNSNTSGPKSSVRKLLLLAAIFWIIRWIGSIAATGSLVSSEYANIPIHLIQSAVFWALFLVSFKFERALLYAVIPVGAIYMTDMFVPGLPVIRFPNPDEFASGLTSLLLLVYGLMGLRR